MKTIYSIALLLALCVSFSCCTFERHEPIGPGLGRISQYYVITYLKVDSIAGEARFWTNTQSTDSLDFYVEMRGKDVYTDRLNKEQFLHYARLYNDTACYKPVSDIFTEEALTDTVTNITIVCDKAYNAAYPAGNSLNEIVKIRYLSAKEYIESGYDDSFINSGREIPLSDFNLQNNYLVGTVFRFTITIPPDKTDSYSFTVTVEMKSGKSFSLQYSSVVLKGK